MISSSSASLDRGLDTMLLVYCALQGHPAQAACEAFVRAQLGWFSSPLVLFEAKAILTKIYSVDRATATQKLAQFCTMPVAILDVDAVGALSALRLADVHRLDSTDAALLQLAQQHGASYLATEDQALARVCMQLGITPESPFDAALRQRVAVWEMANLAPKGRVRDLRRVHEWLSQAHPQAAGDFWSMTAGGSHLP